METRCIEVLLYNINCTILYNFVTLLHHIIAPLLNIVYIKHYIMRKAYRYIIKINF